MFEPPRMPSLDRHDGVRLHVEVTGQGPALLAVHGWSRSGLDLAPLLARLPAHRAILPDLRGHGRSSPGPLDLDTLVDDLAAVAEAHVPGRALLVAWSLGGLVALAALAGRPGLRRRVAGLALLSSTPCFTLRDGWPHGLPARAVEVLAARVRRRPQEAQRRFFDDGFAPGELDEAARLELAPLREAPPPDLGCALAGLEVLATADLRGGLAGLDLPTLVIHGEADPICPPGAGRALSEAIPGARLLTLPGAGHAPFLSRAAEVAAALRAFAREAA
jgi:pimeloyl-[acyl-carrier protein] methyl ester esterase